MRYNQTASIRNHYDLVSPYYRDLWGPHLHHGFWEDGRESPAEAQEALIEELISRAKLRMGLRILDAGCGMGGSSVYLAKNLQAKVTGITISPIQVEMAKAAAERQDVNVSFQVMDAQNMNFAAMEQFDCVWSIEAISHFSQKQKFFEQATKLLATGGTMAITDWFKKPGLSHREEIEFLEPIERGMLIQLLTLADYLKILRDAGNVVEQTANFSDRVAPTWDFCLDIIRDKTLWKAARQYGAKFVDFLESFAAMKKGYDAKALEYRLIVCRKA